MVVKYMYRLLIITWMILAMSCTKNNNPNGIMITEVTVTGSETDKNGKKFCSDFALSPESAEDFFREAKATSLKQLHDEHDYLPCYFYGVASIGNKSCTWEIRAGGTAELKCGHTVRYFACHNCLEPQ